MASGKPDVITILGILVLVALAVFVLKDFVLASGPYSNNRAGIERGVAVEGAPAGQEGAPEVSPTQENQADSAGPQYLEPTYAPGGSPGSQDFGDYTEDEFGTPTPTLAPTPRPSATPTPSPVVAQAGSSRSIRVSETVKDYNE